MMPHQLYAFCKASAIIYTGKSDHAPQWHQCTHRICLSSMLGTVVFWLMIFTSKDRGFIQGEGLPKQKTWNAKQDCPNPLHTHTHKCPKSQRRQMIHEIVNCQLLSSSPLFSSYGIHFTNTWTHDHTYTGDVALKWWLWNQPLRGSLGGPGNECTCLPPPNVQISWASKKNLLTFFFKNQHASGPGKSKHHWIWCKGFNVGVWTFSCVLHDFQNIHDFMIWLKTAILGRLAKKNAKSQTSQKWRKIKENVWGNWTP